MTEAEYRRQVKRLTGRLAYWTRAFNIFNGWTIEHQMERDGLPAPKGEGEVVACTQVQWEYLHASMLWNIPAVADRSDERLDWDICHEFCHVFVAELVNDEQYMKDHHPEERVCSTLASVLLSVHNAQPQQSKKSRPKKEIRLVSVA